MLKTILDFISLHAWRGVLGGFVTAIALLFFPNFLGTYDSLQPLHLWLVVAAIYFGSVLITYPASGLYPSIADSYALHRRKKLAIKRLHNLSEDEKERCRYTVSTNGNSLVHNQRNGAVASLIEHHVFYQPAEPWRRGVCEFRMRDYALEYLKAHPALIEEKKS